MLRTYGLAAGCVGLAMLLRLALDPLWKDRLPYISFFLAILLITRFAENAGPLVFAVVSGFLLGDWFFVAPRHSLLISDPRDQVNALFYFVVCGSVVFFSVRSQRALERERAAGTALGRLAAIIESSEDAIIGKTLEGKIMSWNAGARKLYGYTEAEAVGQPLTFLVSPERGQELAPLLERVGRGEHVSHFETTLRKKDGELAEVSLSLSPVRNVDGQIIGVSTIAHDISGRKRAERERERLLGELQRALAEVKTLSGLLPICSHCKKIRDDQGSWNQIEVYIRDRSNAKFTHSVCPECARLHYPEAYPRPRQG